MKKILIATIFLLLLSSFTAYASCNFTYYVIDGTACISGILAEKAPDTVVIPSAIDGIEVTRIENAVAVNEKGDVQYHPFDLKGAKKLVISEGITKTAWFTGTQNLEEAVLPKSLKTLPSFAFAGAKKLEKINLENIEVISSMSFDGCLALKEINLLSCKKINTQAFNNIHGLTVKNYNHFDKSVYSPISSVALANDAADIKVYVQNNNGLNNFVITEQKSHDYFDIVGTHVYDSNDGEYITVVYVYPKVAMSDEQASSLITVNGLAAKGMRKDMGIYTLYFNTYGAHETAAIKLQKLGLMSGTSTDNAGKTEFELNRTPTRLEALIMLVRLLGKEDPAKKALKDHPFNDVPEWADGYVTYAYKNNILKGITSTFLGSDTPATSQMYITFILRAAGYSDTSANPDFMYSNPWELAEQIGIGTTEKDLFTRGDMAVISYNALFADTPNNIKLFEKLISDRVITEKAWNTINK